MPNFEERYRELDALRGIAVISMILFHLCFDLAFFYGWNIPIRGEFFEMWSRGTAMMFLLVMGICFTISWSRRASTAPRDVILSEAERPEGVKRSRRASWGFAQHDVFFRAYIYYFRRGFLILGGGMVISVATYLLAPGAYVKFGILHLIGVSALLQPLFVRFGIWNVAIGALWTLIGLKISSIVSENVFLFPFGVTYPGFFSLDYYPLFPWFGFVLTGMAVGSMLYVPSRKKLMERLGSVPFPQFLLWSGRQALILYFVHQPIILLVLAMLFGKPLIQ